VDPKDYDAIIEELTANNGMTTLETRFRLAQKAFAHTADYDRAIAGYLSEQSIGDVSSCYPKIM
jgi:phosphoribosylaminoimidazolecarboxamide formyltransferase/IMP cyclohydrolase